MAAIHALGASLAKLILTNTGEPMSESAALVVLDPHTLAVVPFKERDRESIYYAIIRTGLRPDGVDVGRNAIAVTI
jgi:hypothetical protein